MTTPNALSMASPLLGISCSISRFLAEFFNTGRVGSGREVVKSHESGRVGSKGFLISRVWSQAHEIHRSGRAGSAGFQNITGRG